MINVTCNICVMKLFHQKQDYWIQLLHMLFGVGGLTGPFIVASFKDKSYSILGIALLMSAPLFFILNSPENR